MRKTRIRRRAFGVGLSTGLISTVVPGKKSSGLFVHKMDELLICGQGGLTSLMEPGLSILNNALLEIYFIPIFFTNVM